MKFRSQTLDSVMKDGALICLIILLLNLFDFFEGLCMLVFWGYVEIGALVNIFMKELV